MAGGAMMVERADTAARRDGGRLTRLVPALADVLLPLAGYYVFRLIGWDFAAAYAGGAVIGAICLIAAAVRQRRFDGLAAFMFAEFCVHTAIALASDDAKLTLGAQSVTTGVAGIAMLISCLIGRPAFHAIALRTAGQTPSTRSLIEHRYATLPGYRRLMTTLTLICAVVLMTEALLRIVLLLLVSADALVGISRIMQIAVTAGLVVFCTWYAKRSASKWQPR